MPNSSAIAALVLLILAFMVGMSNGMGATLFVFFATLGDYVGLLLLNLPAIATFVTVGLTFLVAGVGVLVLGYLAFVLTLVAGVLVFSPIWFLRVPTFVKVLLTMLIVGGVGYALYLFGDIGWQWLNDQFDRIMAWPNAVMRGAARSIGYDVAPGAIAQMAERQGGWTWLSMLGFALFVPLYALSLRRFRKIVEADAPTVRHLQEQLAQVDRQIDENDEVEGTAAPPHRTYRELRTQRIHVLRELSRLRAERPFKLLATIRLRDLAYVVPAGLMLMYGVGYIKGNLDVTATRGAIVFYRASTDGIPTKTSLPFVAGVENGVVVRNPSDGTLSLIRWEDVDRIDAK